MIGRYPYFKTLTLTSRRASEPRCRGRSRICLIAVVQKWVVCKRFCLQPLIPFILYFKDAGVLRFLGNKGSGALRLSFGKKHGDIVVVKNTFRMLERIFVTTLMPRSSFSEHIYDKRYKMAKILEFTGSKIQEWCLKFNFCSDTVRFYALRHVFYATIGQIEDRAFGVVLIANLCRCGKKFRRF